jgi:hypothetical protein
MEPEAQGYNDLEDTIHDIKGFQSMVAQYTCRNHIICYKNYAQNSIIRVYLHQG